MLLLGRTRCFLLLLTGLLTSLFLAFYVFKVEKSRGGIFESTSCKQPGILYKDNEEKHYLASAENLFKLYDGVETFVMFIGYQRSSHSLVGAILDAHPEIIIPHEYGLMTKIKKYQSLNQSNLQRYALFYDLHHLSMHQAMFGIRARINYTKPIGESNNTKYRYHVSGLWQGGYQKKIKVIGDKKGGVTSEILIDPNNMSKLTAISQIVQVPIKFIHVTRNPFDNIATMMLKKSSTRNAAREAGVIVNNKRHLEKSIANYFDLAASNQRVRERYGDAVIDIPGHETVLKPKETLQRLCDHLGVTCSEDYFEKCSKIMYGTPSVTRDKVVWSNEQIKQVTEMMKNYPFLKDYSFYEYPT